MACTGIKCNGEGAQGQRAPNIIKALTPPANGVTVGPNVCIHAQRERERRESESEGEGKRERESARGYVAYRCEE